MTPRRKWWPLVVLGWALLVSGIGLAGYSGYQLHGTGLLAARAQAKLQADFEARLEGVTVGPDGSVELPTTVPATAAVDPDDVPPVVEIPGHDDPVIGPELRPPPAPAPPPQFIAEPSPAEGEVLGRIVIPAAGVDWMVIEGVRGSDLRQGPGHGPWSAMPGQPGNAVISGHRTTNGAPFGDLDRLEPGDPVAIQTLIGTHVYEVVGTVIVRPAEVWVVEQWEGSWLTLTTCNPRYSSRERLVVFAKLVEGPNAAASAAAFDVDYELPRAPQG